MTAGRISIRVEGRTVVLAFIGGGVADTTRAALTVAQADEVINGLIDAMHAAKHAEAEAAERGRQDAAARLDKARAEVARLEAETGGAS